MLSGRLSSPGTSNGGHRMGRPLPTTPMSPASLAPESAEGERKLVTVLFADIKSSMELIADRDPEEARSVLDPVLDAMVSAVHEYGGTVNQVMGDGIMALFGAPRAQEDHALRACYAALTMKEAMQEVAADIAHDQGVDVRIRIGLNSGDVVVRSIGSDIDIDYTAVGQATHIAARLEHSASPGNILATHATVQLVQGFIETGPATNLQVKGFQSTLKVYEIIDALPLQTRFSARAARPLSRLIGREAETSILVQALERSARGQGQVVGVSGEAGIGKSHLLWDLTRSDRLREWLVLKTGAFSHTNEPLLPLIGLWRTHLNKEISRERARSDRLSDVLNPGESSFMSGSRPYSDWYTLDTRHGRQLLGATRRRLLRESQIQPVCLVFEDLQWVDSATKEFLDSLVDSLRTSSILLLVDFRPGYRHGWEGKQHYRHLIIEALPDDAVDRLLTVLVGAEESTTVCREILRKGALGNPLFLEEGIREMVAQGWLVGGPGAHRGRVSLDKMIVPPLVHAMLASKIDRLSPLQKQVVRCAAVLGDPVAYSVLKNVTSASQPTLRRVIEALQTEGILVRTSTASRTEYRFPQALMREVACRTLLNRQREALLARAADIAASGPGR